MRPTIVADREGRTLMTRVRGIILAAALAAAIVPQASTPVEAAKKKKGPTLSADGAFSWDTSGARSGKRDKKRVRRTK
jgi:hypothetical protein